MFRPSTNLPRFSAPRLLTGTGICAVVLLLPALVVWALGWRWTPAGGGAWLRAGLAITETGSFPFAIITSAILAGVFVWRMRLGRRGAAVFVVLCVATIGCSQMVKVLLKNSLKYSRPYIVWATENSDFKSKDFYELPRNERAAWLNENITDSALVPDALRTHWEAETGYSFPSGHTSFAAIWALLGAALLWPRRERVICVVLIVWALAVETTRLTLGMHWPADIAVAVVLSWVIAVCVALIWQKIVMRTANAAAS